jgi:hypothetical protein
MFGSGGNARVLWGASPPPSTILRASAYHKPEPQAFPAGWTSGVAAVLQIYYSIVQLVEPATSLKKTLSCARSPASS